jgi:hypothetical protein
MSKMLSHLHWGTKNELTYLDGIGTHSTVGSVRQGLKPVLTRKQRLQRYLKTMKRRVRWGDINVATIMIYLSIELSRPDKEVDRGEN